MVSASPTPLSAIARSEGSPLAITVGRVRSRIHLGEKSVGMPSTSMTANFPEGKLDSYCRGENIRHDHDGETEDSGHGGHPIGLGKPHLRRQVDRERGYACQLQHPEGVEAASGASQASVSPSAYASAIVYLFPDPNVVTISGSLHYA